MSEARETQLQVIDTRASSLPATPPPDASPAGLIRVALERGADVAQLTALYELQLRYEAHEARKAYTAAMAAFKAEGALSITKNGEVDFKTDKGRTHYRHATLANVLREVTPRLARHGLSVAWVTKQDPKTGEVAVDCVITHLGGHHEVVTLSGPPDKSGNKNAIQAVGSTVSYLQRYTVLSALGLATEEEDDDAGAARTTRQQSAEKTATAESRPPESRAVKAIKAYSPLLGDDAQGIMERAFGRPATAWDEAQYAELASVWRELGELPAGERPEKARQFFPDISPPREREPGEEG